MSIITSILVSMDQNHCSDYSLVDIVDLVRTCQPIALNEYEISKQQQQHKITV